MKFYSIFFSFLCVASLSAEIPNEYDRFILQKIVRCEKEIANIEATLEYTINPEILRKDPHKSLGDPELQIIYLMGKLSAYDEFLYELD